MPIVEIYAQRPRSRALLAEVPSAVAAALACPPREVWVYVLDVDLCGTGDESTTCGARVVVRGPPEDAARIAAALEATARTVAGVQGEPIEDVWVQWVDVAPGHVFAGGAVRPE